MFTNTNQTILEIINMYENTKRNFIVYSIVIFLDTKGINGIGKISHYVKDVCGCERQTAYAWFSLSRGNKIPLKELVKLAIELNVLVSYFLENTDFDESKLNRLLKSRAVNSEANYDKIEKLLCEGKTDTEIAETLGLHRGTVKRIKNMLNDRKETNSLQSGK